MRAPSAMDLLLAWERGLDQSPTRRALALLGACLPEAAMDKLAGLPIGARDGYLLRLRQSLFGDAVAAVSQCRNCGEGLDVAFSINDISEPNAGKIDPEAIESVTYTHQLQAEGYTLAYRVPTSADLLAITNTADEIEPQLALLQRCVTELEQDGIPVGVNELPDSVIAAISRDMADADPNAEIELALVCSECSHAWPALFDIAAFLWSEIHAWAHRILQDVHTLARAYGWREADILAMSVRRRQIYLELVRSHE
jgi:hypothetical protein